MSKALNRISNVLKGETNRRARGKEIKYLQIDFKQYLELSLPHAVATSGSCESYSDRERDDDASSISSVSTNATMDNIPGPGRTIDTYIYQFFGRKLERFIFRISISSLSPDKIAQRLCFDGSGPWPPDQSPLGDVIQEIMIDKSLCCEPRARIAGLKSLVKQSQSNSLYRSAAALSALIRLSITDLVYGNFYESVAVVEPIFHLGTIASVLDDSHPDKKLLHFLTGLARAQLYYTSRGGKHSDEIALSFRRDLLQILSCQFPQHDPLVALSDACLLFAKTSSHVHSLIVNDNAFSPAVHNIIETTYFLCIFLLRSLIYQHHQKPSNSQLQILVLYTFTRWFESIIDTLLFRLDLGMSYRLPIYALRSPFLAMDNAQVKFLFPVLRDEIHRWENIDRPALPRRVRAKSPEDDIPIHLRNYINLCTLRSRRLLISSDELRREAWDTRKLDHDTFQLGLKYPTFAEEPEEDLAGSLDSAWQIEVGWSDLTSEFLYAREYPHWPNGKLDFGRWRWYKEGCRDRRILGQLCRSNLDWDWDPSSSLERLFKIDKRQKARNPEGTTQARTYPATILDSGFDKGTSDVFILEKGPGVQDKVRIWYETETGEVKYKTFVIYESVEDIVSGSGS